MKVLLVHPPYRHGRSMLPLGMAYVAQYMLNAGHQVKVLDADAFTFTKEELQKRLMEEEYDVLGIGCMVTAYNFVLETSDFVKKKKPMVNIMVGGKLATHSYKVLLKNSSVDFCVIGEGELTAVELLSALAGERDFNEVDGIAYMKDGILIKTKERTPVEDLDDLPYPARDIFHASTIYSRTTNIGSVFKSGRSLTISGSRGCPYSCTFCGYDRKVRLRSAKSLFEELKYLKKKYKIKNFAFEDDLFMVKRDRTNEFCERLISEKLNLYWRCAGRIDLVDKEVLTLMKKAGCYAIGYGIESGSPELLKSMKKNILPEQVEKAVRLTREAGIWPGGSWLLGMPGENKETVEKSVALYKSINKYRNICNEFFIATPYPGTELYEDMQGKGKINDEHNYLKRIAEVGDAVKFSINCTDSFTDEELVETKKRIDVEVKKDFYRKHPFLLFTEMIKLRKINRIIIYFRINGFMQFLSKVSEKVWSKISHFCLEKIKSFKLRDEARCAVIIQARMSSDRFPGKMMSKIAGTPLIEYVYKRCLESSTDKVLIATSNHKSDDVLYDYCIKKGMPVMRGSLDDVLERYIRAAESVGVDYIARICGDTPFVDISLVDEMLKTLIDKKIDYVTINRQTCESGFLSEAVTLKALKKADTLTSTVEDREHVTKFILNGNTIFSTQFLDVELNSSTNKKKRLTIDYPEDIQRANSIIDELNDKVAFTSREILEIVNNKKDL